MAVDGQGKKVGRMHLTMMVDTPAGMVPMELSLLEPNTHLRNGDVQLRDGSVNEYVVLANPSGIVRPEDFKESKFWRPTGEDSAKRHTKGHARRASVA